MRFTKCPYCGRWHPVRAWANILCPCGAKYYIHTREWWDRTRLNSKKEDTYDNT